jgi:flagellar basal-body rod modification protein FlgD
MEITATNSIGANTAAAGTGFASQVMSQGDFLKLLIAQMTSQDPINPMDNQDMLAQMVQFSTLQGNTNLQTMLHQMQSGQSLLQANALIGREVALQVDDQTLTHGIVSGVDVSSGTPLVVVNGAVFDLSQVLAITNPSSNP